VEDGLNEDSYDDEKSSPTKRWLNKIILNTFKVRQSNAQMIAGALFNNVLLSNIRTNDKT
jgi:hypothetical protein